MRKLWTAIFSLLLAFAAQQAAAQTAEGAAPAPANVDYGDIDHWLCHPDNELDVCDHDLAATVVNADGSTAIETWWVNPNPEVDCFYIYPTTSLDEGTFADLHPGRREEIITVFTQFARFGSVCRVFAPIYRQITIPALLSNAGNLAGNEQINYIDTVAAFRHYIENHNNGRGFVLVGHSQGTSLLIELIRNEIEGTALREQLVSAVLAGNTVLTPKGETRGGSFNEVPLCESTDQIGCVISFAAYRDDVAPNGEGLFLFGRAPDDTSEAACFNPGNPADPSTEAPLDAYLSNIGEIFASVGPLPVWSATAAAITTPFVKVPGLLYARCVNDGGYHYLALRIAADPTDPRADDIRGDVLINGEISAMWGLHLIDMTLTMGNLVAIVGRQAEIYTAR